ncbi:MAG TPA: hypothetical protein VF214_05085 [Edaphobacter sp.]
MRRMLAIAGLALVTTMNVGQTAHQAVNQTRVKPKPLSDAALDRITAGGTDNGAVTAGISNGVIQFQGQVPTTNGLVSGAGTMAFVQNTTTGTINLSDNAQQNLNSLVNITAVNSSINVLLNLNVNINSTVGTVTQSNLSKH